METPELDKIHAAQQESEIIGAFLKWCDSNGYHLSEEITTEVVDWRGAESSHTDYVPVENLNTVLLKYFNIDPAKVAAEHQAALDEIRKASVCQRSATPQEENT